MIPEKRDEFIASYDDWFAKEFCEKHRRKFFRTKFSGKEWIPQRCCKVATKFDSRTLGRFHVEWIGKEIVALCSKCYYCSGSDDKYSSKGVSKKNNYNVSDYREVLDKAFIKKGVNRGIRVKGSNVYTYLQEKKGLNFFYGKRLVQENGIDTKATRL